MASCWSRACRFPSKHYGYRYRKYATLHRETFDGGKRARVVNHRLARAQFPATRDVQQFPMSPGREKSRARKSHVTSRPIASGANSLSRGIATRFRFRSLDLARRGAKGARSQAARESGTLDRPPKSRSDFAIPLAESRRARLKPLVKAGRIRRDLARRCRRSSDSASPSDARPTLSRCLDFRQAAAN